MRYFNHNNYSVQLTCKYSFLIASWQYEKLKRCEDLPDVSETLSLLPQNLTDLYEFTFSEKARKVRAAIILVFCFLYYCAWPTNVEGMEAAIATDLDDQLEGGIVPDPSATWGTLPMCEPFIVTVEFPGSKVVHLAHHTVKEYFDFQSIKQGLCTARYCIRYFCPLHFCQSVLKKSTPIELFW